MLHLSEDYSQLQLSHERVPCIYLSKYLMVSICSSLDIIVKVIWDKQIPIVWNDQLYRLPIYLQLLLYHDYGTVCYYHLFCRFETSREVILAATINHVRALRLITP